MWNILRGSTRVGSKLFHKINITNVITTCMQRKNGHGDDSMTIFIKNVSYNEFTFNINKLHMCFYLLL